MAGDDRLWGDSGNGNVSDQDYLYGGQGNDDLIGGLGKNELYNWTMDPAPGGQFGVFVDSAGNLHDNDGDLNKDGVLDTPVDANGDGVLETAPWQLEDTGLNRLLGSAQDDKLYGGTGVDFMFGNGGDDHYFRADGSEFQSLDGGALGEDVWKQYARESGKVWYVGATAADDIINLDYVTEPGLLADKHLITRLTNNNGNFSFAAQFKLDFNATDENGEPIWDPADVQIDLERFQQHAQGQNTDQSIFVEKRLVGGLLPPEADFDVILIDALEGNDQVYVGPTVQKTVWVDAGPGDDKVVISAGNSILADRAELAGNRNDLPEFAFGIRRQPGYANSRRPEPEPSIAGPDH